MFKNMKLGMRIMLLSISLTALGIIALVAILVNQASKMQSRAAEENLTEKARVIGAKIDAELEVPLDEARGISYIFERIDAYIRENRRKRLNTMLKHVLESNKQYLGVWTCWEPNALDTLDDVNANTPGHDATGRFIPYWNRGSGEVKLEPLVDYDKEGAGDYYLLAKKFNKEVIINPYKYVAGGKEVLITSVVVPINSLDGRFMGVIGIDIEMSNMTKYISEIKIGETGYCYLISNNAVICAHPKAEFNGGKTRDIEKYSNMGEDTPDNIERIVKEGKELALEKYSALSGKSVFRTYVPFIVGKTSTPWSVAVNQDMDEIHAPVQSMVWTSLIIGFVVLVIISIVLFFIMNNLTKTINKLKERLQKAISAVLDGKLDFRADTKDIHPEFQPMLTGMNELIDAFVQPINVTAEYIDRVSKGDIPPKITDSYKGDFNEIKNNLNTLIDSISDLINEMNNMSHLHDIGDIDIFIDTKKFHGVYREMAAGVNNMVAGHISVKKKAMACVKEFGEGNFDAHLEQFPGKKAFINETIELVRDNIKTFISEMNNMSHQHDLGDIDVTIDTDKFKGDFEKMASGVNTMVNGHIAVKKKAMACFMEFGNGNLDAVIEKFPGKKAFINDTVEKVRANIKELIADSLMLSKAAEEGKLDVRANASKHKGDFKKIVDGVNSTLDNVIGPLNVAAEYVDRISKGDIPPKIQDDYHGDFNEIKNNLNQCIDAVNLLISDSGKLAKAASEGKLDTRADANRHQGGFREIVAGVNKTLDNVIGPLNVAAEYVDRISKGDIPPKITDDYKGDFNEIKNNLNTCIDAVEHLVKDAVMLSKAAIAGDFETRADESKHQGDFKEIVEGVNGTLDTIVDKIFWFEQLMDAMPNPISVTDMDMKWTFLNKAAETVTGFNRKDIVGQHCSNWNADICNTDKCGISCLKRGQSTSFFQQPGMDMYFQVDVHYITNANGVKIGHIEVVQDITPAKKVELQQEEARRIAEKVMEYQTNEAEKLTDSLTQMMNGNLDFKVVVGEGDDDTMGVQEIFGQIASALNQTVKAIKNLTADTIQLAEAASVGDLKYRANAASHKGEYKAIIEGINNTLDAVIEPINEAGNVLSIMATGDLTARMEGNYEGDLLELKTNINTLGDSLQNLIARVSENVQQSASAAIEISSTAESLAASAQEQSAQADEVSSAVEEMSRTVTENAQSANRTSEVAHRNGKMATEGGTVVERTVGKMRDIAEVVKNSAENIQKLGESSKQIGEIISVIDDIADQTNLLALNAAIEAARAGEQGRGFAVVADEVRKLAERTTEATKQIAKMIKGIQEETDAAVLAMNKGNDEVKSGIELADKAGRSLHDILSSTQEVLDMINQIAAASEQQSATSEEISKNVLSISRVTAESARRIEDVAHSADGLSKMTEQLTDLMSHFRIDGNSGYSTMKNQPMKRIAPVQKKHLTSGR